MAVRGCLNYETLKECIRENHVCKGRLNKSVSVTLRLEYDSKRTGAALIMITFAMDATVIKFSVNLSSAMESHLQEIMTKYRTPEVGFLLVRLRGRLDQLTIPQKLGEERCQPIELHCV